MSGRVQAAAIPEAPTHDKPPCSRRSFHRAGPTISRSSTLNGWTLPWRMNGDWKEFHLVAEPVVREFAPGMKANLWGYNGQAPGPTIEAVEGDKVRIFVTNKLPEHTTVHWHGMLLPNGMDGVGGVTQPHIEPGKTFVYEFELKTSGTFMYHPHSDEMVQMAMGMMGMFVVHPRDPRAPAVDRDFVFIMSAYADRSRHLPAARDRDDRFQLWTWNSRVFPGIDPCRSRLGDRVRIRMGNLTMTNHPIHLHGHHFAVTGTDGGWMPESARWPEATVDVPVGADARDRVRRRQPGRLGVPLPQVAPHDERDGPQREDLHRRQQQRDLTRAIRKLVPDYMPMGTTRHGRDGRDGDGDADNTLPMMTGLRPVRPDRDGRHVHGDEDPRGPRRQRLQGPRRVQASGRAPSRTNSATPATAPAQTTPRQCRK